MLSVQIYHQKISDISHFYSLNYTDLNQDVHSIFWVVAEKQRIIINLRYTKENQMSWPFIGHKTILVEFQVKQIQEHQSISGPSLSASKTLIGCMRGFQPLLHERLLELLGASTQLAICSKSPMQDCYF
jgi:hypothetical protein